jgi:PTH1 family peptidyl-tRNA hydrolase
MCRLCKRETPEATTVKIVVGLGNPGREYGANRHNVGYQIVDLLATSLGLTFGRRQGRARVAVGSYGEQRVILVKPRAFMNESGGPVARVARYYRIDLSNMMVIFDDLDLPIGRIRLRPAGGTGGHKGMASIIRQLGSSDFPRLRVGIGRPPGKMDPSAYVLQDFSTEQEEVMAETRRRAVAAVERWLAEGIAPAMNDFNSPTMVPSI